MVLKVNIMINFDYSLASVEPNKIKKKYCSSEFFPFSLKDL